MTSPTEKPPRHAWGVVVLFTLVYTLHSVDRFVISVVIEPIRHEFGLTDTQLGAIGGIAHALAYSAFVLPMGYLLDRGNRVRLLSIMLGLWSLMTTFGALATGYWHLFLARMGVGAAESATSPAIQSLISSLFSTKARASALGVVFSGVAIGTGLVFALGGVIADKLGWRYVFLVAGLPGLILAVLIWLLLSEPPRRTTVGVNQKAASLPQALLFVGRSPSVLFGIAGLTLVSMCVASAWTWITPILIRQQHFSLAAAGLVVGIAAGAMKFVSTFVSGFLADWIAKGCINRLWVVPSCALAISFPAAIGITFGTASWVVVASTMLLGFTLGTHYAAPRSVIMSVTPESMRGSVASTEQLMVNLLGAGMGPLLTGAISDRVGGTGSVSVALLATLSLNPLAALCFWLSARGAREIEELAPAGPAATAAPDLEATAAA